MSKIFKSIEDIRKGLEKNPITKREVFMWGLVIGIIIGIIIAST